MSFYKINVLFTKAKAKSFVKIFFLVLEKQFQLKSAAYVYMTSHNYRCDKLKSKPFYLQVNLDINQKQMWLCMECFKNNFLKLNEIKTWDFQIFGCCINGVKIMG